jgi:hypothetical protein
MRPKAEALGYLEATAKQQRLQLQLQRQQQKQMRGFASLRMTNF